jgi:hypothetical protein
MNPDNLSLRRFKGVDPTSLPYEDYLDFVFATLMNDAIEIVEAAIPNERQYHRAKFNLMRATHQARELLK